MIQLLGATRHKLVADLAPASLQISLEIALEQVDRMTEGRVFFWPTPEGPPERVRVRGEQWFSYFGVRLDQRSHEHMLKMLANDLSGLIIPRSSVDQVTQIQAGSKRIVLGHLGEHITPQIVFTLHRECQDGETGHIYPIGRVTPEAIKEAARLNIQIHDLTKLKDHLGSAEIMNDDATVY